MESKTCGKCKEEKSVDEFYKSARDGHRSVCKDCGKILSREYNRTPDRKAYNRLHYDRLKADGYFDEYMQRPEVKERKCRQMREYNKLPKYIKAAEARSAVRTGKANGTLVQQSCCCCGEKETEAHHPDYDSPLEVVWLCREDHRKEHNKINAKARGEVE